ncbi:hypothetical protein KAJ27_08340 [bacterium]|nr:hypothetical protein [bacterium]
MFYNLHVLRALHGKIFILFLLLFSLFSANSFCTEYRDKINYVKALMRLEIYDSAEEKIDWVEKKYGKSTELTYLKGKMMLVNGHEANGKRILNKIHLQNPNFKRNEIKNILGISIVEIKIPKNVTIKTFQKEARKRNSFFARAKQKIMDTAYYQMLGGVVVSFFLLPM